MEIVQFALFLVFIALTVIGYQKNSRDLMLLGACSVVLSFVGIEFMLGFYQGSELHY
jgi:hypothetical protein